ncbi:MAG TPA: sporulation protein YabP [Thermoanaerobacterales bacterium]|nr:sporulation protein YabP [Thermoanaerobacterales bacterium]
MADIKDLEHSMNIKDRELINLNGVLSVKKFDEKIIDLETHMGELTIKGENLYVRNLNLEKGELAVEGYIKGVYYGENKYKEKGSLLKRLFK